MKVNFKITIYNVKYIISKYILSVGQVQFILKRLNIPKEDYTCFNINCLNLIPKCSVLSSKWKTDPPHESNY